MVAAGSVVAAVQGLYLKSLDASFSSQNLTNLLSQVIGSDPVCRHILMQCEASGVRRFVTGVHLKPCVLAGLLAGMSGADRGSAGVQLAAGSAPRRHRAAKVRGRRRGPVLHPNRCEGCQHLNLLMAMVGNGPRLQRKGAKVATGISSESC